MLHPLLETRYRDLVDAWLRYQDLSCERTKASELADSRMGLDWIRSDMWRLRRALAPEPAELEEMAGAVYCSDLDATVFVGHVQVAGHMNPTSQCVCGRQMRLEATR